MDDPTRRDHLRHRFWERFRLDQMTPAEWEALCDGCGKCCLNKLEDEETGEVALTRVACRLFDTDTCRCSDYPNRHARVPECIKLTPKNVGRHAYWLPSTCAYRLLHEGKPLYDWHPLISGRPESVFEAGVSAQGIGISELDVPEEEWEDWIIEEPGA